MADQRAQIAADLAAARRRSLALLDPLSESDQLAQHSPLMSPLVWDLAHVGHYEELWLLRAVARTAPIDPAHDDVYDAFRHPRASRGALDILGPSAARRHNALVRDRVLDVLESVELDPAVPLLAGGRVYGMVAQHEHQHDETMLATLNLMARPYPHTPAPAPPGRPLAADVAVPGGPFVMGADAEPWAYDNERPAHVVDLPPFRIDTAPVTNRAYLAFVDGGGYDERRFWSAAGWAWKTGAGHAAPGSWERSGNGSWTLRRFGRRIDLPLDEPVQHVCWYEADAYARAVGRRLPTEAEWERAAGGVPDPSAPASGGHGRPGGPDRPPEAVANLGGARFGPAPVGAYPAGRSDVGAEQLLGDVWEWTASDFAPYPGFCAFPYREYSEVFYDGTYKVLRGGSWATDPLCARRTFRNWDLPVRRQIFAGFRCAADA